MKHIDFGQGFYFLMDLQQFIKQNNSQLSAATDGTNSTQKGPSGDQLEFTYNLGELKIELPGEEGKK